MHDPIAQKNLDLAFEVMFQVLADPDLADEAMSLGEKATIVLYDDADPELTAANDRMAEVMEARGERVVKASVLRRTTLAPR